MRGQIAKRFASLIFLVAPSAESFAAESWTCTYPGLLSREPVTVSFVVEGDKLVQGLGPDYKLLENNQYALIGVEHYSEFDQLKGAVRIFSSTVYRQDVWQIYQERQ
jgi:hypothetical protein